MSNYRIWIGASTILTFAIGVGAIALAQETSPAPSGETVFNTR